MKLPRFLVGSLVITLIMLPRLALAQDGPRQLPKLVLQITIDQLRGDMPTRFIEDQLGEGGFRYLLEKGIVYAEAHHPHANTETIVGHTTCRQERIRQSMG